jgi:hypothetical protein
MLHERIGQIQNRTGKRANTMALGGAPQRISAATRSNTNRLLIVSHWRDPVMAALSLSARRSQGPPISQFPQYPNMDSH